MTEWTKTFTFAGVAVVVVGLAFAAQSLSRPSAPKEFERVGEEFYPDFQDPLSARSLEVVSYNNETSYISKFNVTWGKDGWTISPHGYPADAEDQLEKTAASVVGIERAGLASRREADYERYGVIDPLSEDSTQLKGRGRRITLKDTKGQVLADYILGNPIEGQDGYYYIRIPKEDETYIAKVDLNLTTRFADWIESDLLKVSASDLARVEIRDYSLNEDRGTITNRDESVLVRGDDASGWTLEGLDETTEQVNISAVNGMTRVLDELKIIGVRPKPKGLNPDLSLDRAVINNQLAAEVLRSSLAGKGFYLAQVAGSEELQLVAKEGQLTATTKNGVSYDLYFGEQFSGSQFDLEYGDGGENSPSKALKETEPKASDTGRYVFIAARFEPSSMGAEPTPPADPTPPAEGASEEEKKTAEQAAEKAKSDFESAKKAHEQKVADAKKTVEELNDRFEDWYYVISTENFEDLRLSREALVSPKAEESPSPEDSVGKEVKSESPLEAPKPFNPSAPSEASQSPPSET